MALQPLSDLPLPPELALDEAPFDVDEFESLDEVGDDHPARSWRIEDDGAAEWAMRNLVVRRQRIEDLARRRDDWMARIDAWFVQAAKEPSRSAEFFEGALADYMRRRREEDEETKSIPLPSGRITSTGTGGKPAVVDNDAVVAWIEETCAGEYDALVKDEPSVRIGELRKRLRVVERANEVVDLRLECGHVAEAFENPGAEVVACEMCDPDPIDESLPERAVVGAETRIETEQIVIHADLGYPVPGVVVEPAGFNVSVKPDAS